MLRALLSNRLLSGWVCGLLTSVIVALGLAVWIIFGGAFNTEASKPHFALVGWAAHTTMIHSVKQRSKKIRPPSAFTQADVMSGAKAYEQNCIACHGGAAVARAPWASAMLPTPPFLIDSSQRWSTAELYRIVHDGVKMTAMPAWGEIEPDQKIWDLVAFLQAMPRLAPSEFKRILSEARAEPPAPGGAQVPNASPRPEALETSEP